MALDLKKLQDLLADKAAFLEKQQGDLEEILIDLGARFANDLALLIGRGVHDWQQIAIALDSLGYTQAVLERLEQVRELVDFSRQISAQFGINFLLTEQQEAQLVAFLSVARNSFENKFRDAIAKDMALFAIQGQVSQIPKAQIIAQVENELAAVGRRAGTEVYTALTIFDRSVMADQYENAGIDRFFYFPPTLLTTSRDSCRAALASDKQQTGWTRADIQNAPDLDFVKGGEPYYNCRHTWLPFDKELAETKVREFVA